MKILILNKNTNENIKNDNDNNDDNVSFLMTKALIIVIMEELLIITKVTVVKLTFKRNSMEKKNKNKN